MIGDFKTLDNEIIKEFSGTVANKEESLNAYAKRKEDSMKKELAYVISTLGNLDKTIGNLRLDVKSRMDSLSYSNWTKLMDDTYKEFMCMYSARNEDIYQAARKEEQKMNAILTSINVNITRIMGKLFENKKAEKDKLFGSDVGYEMEEEKGNSNRKEMLAKQLLNALPEDCNQEEFLEAMVDAANNWKTNQRESDFKEKKNEKNEERRAIGRSKKKSRWDDEAEVLAKRLRTE